MAVNQVYFGNETLMDITDTTAEQDGVRLGDVFYAANGERQVGTAQFVGPYTSDPAPLGNASPGSSDDYARGDHVHPKPSPSDVGAVNKTGDTMSGALNMGSNKITGLADGTNDSDAVNLGQLEGLISGGGLTPAIKAALLQLAEKVAYIDEHGQDYYDDLYDALYAVTAISVSPSSVALQTIGGTQQLTATTTPSGATVTWASSNTAVATVDANGLVTSVGYGSATITATAGQLSATCSVVVAQATVTSIDAAYTQSGTVYDTDSLDSLKDDLVVTAHWSNGTTSTVASADYTLSGTLTTGTSTVTVSYAGQTTTFNVTVVSIASITATYTQSGTVYDTDTLDSLKSDLVVTATYSDSSTQTVPSTDYTLSGTLTAGTSTITVAYGGKTTTFTVTVSHADNSIISWDFKQSLTDSKQGLVATLGGNATRDSSGLHINSASDYVILGQFLANNQSYEIDVADMDTSAWTTGNGRLFVWYNGNGGGLGYHGDTATWSIYRGNWYDPATLIPSKDYFENSTIKMKVTSGSSQYRKIVTIYKNGTEIMSAEVNNDPVASGQNVYLGSTQSGAHSMTITGFRVYSEV